VARQRAWQRNTDTAAIVVVTNAKPSPVAASRDGQRMSVVNPPPTEIRENQSSATTINPIPAASTGLKPIFVTSWEAIPDAAMIISASGRYEGPAGRRAGQRTVCLLR